MNKPKDYIKLISLSWDKAVIAFNLTEMAVIKVECLKPNKNIIAETTEIVDIGRIYLKSLKPATKYKIKVRWKRRSRQLNFTTLPKPSGKLISAFAVLADPHISEKKENRKGRLFVEAESILSTIVEELNELNVDFTLIAGDLTNKGTPWEYKRAKSILQVLKKPLLAVPGDHDIKSTHLWNKYFGPLQWTKDIKGYRITGVNTARSQMDAEGYELVRKTLNSKKRFPMIVSHLQFFENPTICLGTKKKTVSPQTDQEKQLLESIKEKQMIIYAGHQNIAVKVDIGKSIQVNIPQPVQYVCGYYLVQRYENGFYHTFMPIKSEILQQYSRQGSNTAALLYGEKQWGERYREGPGIETSNFVLIDKI